jgi:5-methylcytosine-specific restriction endonuclease McrA
MPIEDMKAYKRAWRAARKATGVCYDCGSTCLRCLAKEPDVQITIDHIVPISRNGANTIRNVQPLCSRCNKSKNARTVDFRTPGILAFVREMFIT